MSLNIAGDCLLFDGTEAVTLTSVRDSGDVTDAAATALKHQLSDAEAIASGGVYTNEDVTWNLPASQLAVTPKPGDTITDSSSVVWTVLRVDHATLKTRWRLTCRDLVLANDLSDTIEIWKPTYQPSETGSRVPTWTPHTADLACRIQEISSDVIEERGKRGIRRSYEMYIASRVTVTNDYQVRHQGSDGEEIYEIRGWRDPDRIDALMTLICERRFADGD